MANYIKIVRDNSSGVTCGASVAATKLQREDIRNTMAEVSHSTHSLATRTM